MVVNSSGKGGSKESGGSKGEWEQRMWGEDRQKY
jgi:hypothetical protein